jgi:hypothetical protein
MATALTTTLTRNRGGPRAPGGGGGGGPPPPQLGALSLGAYFFVELIATVIAVPSCVLTAILTPAFGTFTPTPGIAASQ